MAEIKITRIETALPQHVMPGLLAVRVYTDAGYVGCGETYYAPHAVAAMIHDWISRRLLGADALQIEGHFRFLYERAANFGARGTELRAISALDLALWDILGQATEQPVWQLLGGRTRDAIPVYNSSGGPAYGGRGDKKEGDQGWPGHGIVGNEGPFNDYWSLVNNPVDYARSLLDEGIRGLKAWTLDFAAHKPGGPLYISHKDLDEGLRPLRTIREALGSDIELMIDGHGFFQLAAALRICRAVRDLDLQWLEDIIRPDSVDTIADLRQKADVPLAVSEMLVGYEDFRLVLENRAADYVMIDPTWVGGISQTRRVAELSQFYNVPVVMHDCTGPFTLLSGIHVATAAPNVAWQETLRAHIRLLYPQLIRESIEVVDGHAHAPTTPGIGATWQPELFERSDANVRVSEE
ncbi:MAG: mandelate racemase/muconate lactonizing enzyme family protein [Gemmatimonadota bacterium]|nr:mandelate racemase/muconate lactonizing enzyme family protein [Gemmatimonadota bacterium]